MNTNFKLFMGNNKNVRVNKRQFQFVYSHWYWDDHMHIHIQKKEVKLELDDIILCLCVSDNVKLIYKIYKEIDWKMQKKNLHKNYRRCMSLSTVFFTINGIVWQVYSMYVYLIFMCIMSTLLGVVISCEFNAYQPIKTPLVWCEFAWVFEFARKCVRIFLVEFPNFLKFLMLVFNCK